MTDLITAYSYLNDSRRDDRAKLFLEQSHSEGQWPQIAFHRFKLHARQHPEGQHWTGYTENPQNCHLWGFSGHGCPDPAMATALRRWRDHWRSVPITASLILSACLERELWLKYFYPVYGSNMPWVHQKSFLPNRGPNRALLVLHSSLEAGLHCCSQLPASWASAGSASVHADSLNAASRAWGSCKPSTEGIKHILVLPHHHL